MQCANSPSPKVCMMASGVLLVDLCATSSRTWVHRLSSCSCCAWLNDALSCIICSTDRLRVRAMWPWHCNSTRRMRLS